MGSLFGGGGASSYQQPQVETSAYPGTVRPRMDVANDRAALGQITAAQIGQEVVKRASGQKPTIATKTTLGPA